MTGTVPKGRGTSDALFFLWALRGATLLKPPVAITTLAGANILLRGHASFLAEFAPFIKGFTVFFWAAGTWWIPYLFILGAWRPGRGGGHG